jgi:hypothetical protein
MQPMMQGWYVACLDKSNGGAIFDLKLKHLQFSKIHNAILRPRLTDVIHGALL